MKKIILFLLLTQFTLGQEKEIPSENYFWPYNYNLEKAEGKIGVKNCYVRSSQSVKSELKDSLQIGQTIKILENTNEYLKIKGLNLSWVKISYTKNNQLKTGYLWKGFIAINDATAPDRTQFITTVDRKFIKKENRENYQYVADYYDLTSSVINSKNEIIAQKTTAKDLSESKDSFSNVIKPWGLKNLQSIYRFGIGGGACAVPTNYLYYGFTGNELLTMPEKYEVGDANAYYHTEEFIFPEEKGGLPDTIIKNISDAENTDESLEGDKFLIKKTIEYYSWDGSVFKLKKTKKIKPYYQKG